MQDKRITMTATASLRAGAMGALALLAAALAAGPAQAQHYPVTAGQRATAQQVASHGVPLSELAPNAPASYVVQRGDTLWAISGMYLKRPWRWPELWGMNLDAIQNPHLIYPGQTLYLDTSTGMARLRFGAAGATPTVRVSPRTRSESLAQAALPTLKAHLIEPFLVEPQVVDELTLEQAPRIVATRDDQRVLLSNNDRAYARGPEGRPLALAPGAPRQYQVYRNATPLKDPQTQEVLGYEAQYVGRADLVRGESVNGDHEIVPATIDLSGAREEIRPGDRLLPAPQRSYANYVPHAPQSPVDARVVSIYGSAAVALAAANQVVTINRGARDGMEVGHVLTLLTGGQTITDKTDTQRTTLRLPSEPNGTAMVFRTFDRVSYALILQAQQGVRVGDRLVNPE